MYSFILLNKIKELNIHCKLIGVLLIIVFEIVVFLPIIRNEIQK